MSDAAQNILSGQVVVWSSSAEGVATVSQSGLVTAISPGMATVSATAGGQLGTATVTVTNVAVATVTLNTGTVAMVGGDDRVLLATVKDAGGNVLIGHAVNWTSTNLNVVNGFAFADTVVITGLAAGTATVTAAVEGHAASAQVTVTAPTASICSTIAGASIFSADEQYLGRFTNQFGAQSVLNQFGVYGSQYSSTSTNNPYGQYGSGYSPLSARNPSADDPPFIVKNGVPILYYTTNPNFPPRVSPAYALTCSFP